MNKNKPLNIGMLGTFDVANYGDLLFPLLAEHELSKRVGPVNVHPFSYNHKSTVSWPFAVTSLSELANAMPQLDGILVGGGHIIRFDKEVAPNYLPPSAEIHHPTGYWLAPILMAQQQQIPIAWNAPGATDPIHEAFCLPMEMAISGSDYIAVRDVLTKEILVNCSPHNCDKIIVSPDTAFGVSNLVSTENPSPEFLDLCAELRLTRPYIVVHASPGLDGFIKMVRENHDFLNDFQLVGVPIGPILGDDCSYLTNLLPELIPVGKWPNPKLLAEIIAHAAATVGISLHLSVTAMSFGIPSFRPGHDFKKFDFLQEFESIYYFKPEGETTSREWFQRRLEEKPISLAFKKAQAQLERHWDTVAALFQTKSTINANRQLSVDTLRFWQSLPNAIEKSFKQLYELRKTQQILNQELDTAQTQQHQLIQELSISQETQTKLTQELTDVKIHNQHLADELSASRQKQSQLAHDLNLICNSLSWRTIISLRKIGKKFPWFVAPTKYLLRSFIGHKINTSVLQIDQIAKRQLVNHPYQWAMIDKLFTAKIAKALARSYPYKYFKTVAGYDGEKGYEYEAYSLIHMGADTVSHPDSLNPVWITFARDLLSLEYRRALSQLTGIDLTQAPMEANVFHYGPGAWLGPHLDLKDKIVTHVFYFNENWQTANGGCLMILGSKDITDVIAEIPPIIGNSSVLVRSDNSWHAVSRVVGDCDTSRRSLTVTFYHANSISTMWPPGDKPALQDYQR